jgi:hypothetical protein
MFYLTTLSSTKIYAAFVVRDERNTSVSSDDMVMTEEYVKYSGRGGGKKRSHYNSTHLKSYMNCPGVESGPLHTSLKWSPISITLPFVLKNEICETAYTDSSIFCCLLFSLSNTYQTFLLVFNFI